MILLSSVVSGQRSVVSSTHVMRSMCGYIYTIYGYWSMFGGLVLTTRVIVVYMDTNTIYGQL